MLTFGRTVGEAVIIGNDVEVRVVSIRGGQVKLGVTAPREVPIERPERNAGRAPATDMLRRKTTSIAPADGTDMTERRRRDGLT